MLRLTKWGGNSSELIIGGLEIEVKESFQPYSLVLLEAIETSELPVALSNEPSLVIESLRVYSTLSNEYYHCMEQILNLRLLICLYNYHRWVQRVCA